MKKTLLVLTAAVFLAASAQAATLTLVSVTPLIRNPGEVITLQLRTSFPAGQTPISLGLDVRTFTSNNSVVSWTGAVQVALRSNVATSAAYDKWSKFPTTCPIAAGECLAVNQGNPALGDTNWPLGAPPNAATDILLSTISAIAGAPGTSSISVSIEDYFGISSGSIAPLLITVVPEPGTLALLGFGLTGLVLAGRRRG